MQACTLTFTVAASTGVQTITGVVDKDGNSFTGKVFIFQGGYCTLNTLTSSPSGWHWDLGIAHGTTYGGAAGSGCYPFGTAKIATGAAGSGYSVMDTRPNIFFGGAIDQLGYVSRVASGEFDITWDSKVRNGDTRIVTILGGADLNIDGNYSVTNATVSTTADPVGVLALSGVNKISTGSLGSATGAGGSLFGFGWDTKTSGRGSAGALCVNQGSNYKAFRTDALLTELTTVGAITGGTPIVSSWGTNQYTVTGASGARAFQALAFSGTNIACAAGSITQQSSTGHQTFGTGINPRLLIFVATGGTTTGTVDSEGAQLVSGWTDRTRQASYWTSETVVGNGAGIKGARYMSDSTILRFGSANAGSTSFDAIASFVSANDMGEVTIDWTTNDGGAREILWFALGEEATYGSLDYTKVWDSSVTNRPEITLKVGTAPYASDVSSISGDDPVISLPTLTPGTYYLSESGQGRQIAGTIACEANGAPITVGDDGEITVSAGDMVVCTITNVLTPLGTRPKQWKLYEFNSKIRKEERS